MTTQKIKVTGDYNYKWPSKARTALKEGTTPTVKQVVADAAIKAGKAEAIGKPIGQKPVDDKSDSTSDTKSK